MATWMTALGNMGAAITSTKDVYKPSDNITSTWSSLAKNLVAAAGVIGISAAAKTAGVTPTLVRTTGGTPAPSIQQAGVTGGQGVGNPQRGMPKSGFTPSQVGTSLWIVAGLVVVGIVILVAMRPAVAR